MTTIEQKLARIKKLKSLGKDVSKYEAKLPKEEKPEPKTPVRRIGRPPRHE